MRIEHVIIGLMVGLLYVGINGLVTDFLEHGSGRDARRPLPAFVTIDRKARPSYGWNHDTGYFILARSESEARELLTFLPLLRGQMAMMGPSALHPAQEGPVTVVRPGSETEAGHDCLTCGEECSALRPLAD